MRLFLGSLVAVGIIWFFVAEFLLLKKCFVQPEHRKTALEENDLLSFVDPLIGSGGWPLSSGMQTPAVSSPFGFMRLGPDTVYRFFSIWPHLFANMATSGYFYGHSHVLGFSHTRLVGTGIFEGGHFRILPQRKFAQAKQYPRLNHRREKSQAGFYRLDLEDAEVQVELTAHQLFGMHRYTFHGFAPKVLVIDAASALGRKSFSKNVSLDFEDNLLILKSRTNGTISKKNNGFLVQAALSFSSAPIKSVKLGSIFFAEFDQREVLVRIALSRSRNEKSNLQKIQSRSFSEVKQVVQDNWREVLSLIHIETQDRQLKKNFYSSLYRAFVMPTNYSESMSPRYSDLSLWDTFRTVNPLYMLIAPAVQSAIVANLLEYEVLPKWPVVGEYSGLMLGDPAVITIAESILKNISGIDKKRALELSLAKARAEFDPKHLATRRGLKDCLTSKFCPAGSWSVSRTVEFAWADDALARMAAKLGRQKVADEMRARARYYENLWDDEAKFFRPRFADGSWRSSLTSWGDYAEGTAHHWRFSAAFDGAGLLRLFGDRELFVSELDSFLGKTKSVGALIPSWYYWHGNEHDIHAAYLFNEASRGDLTQKWVRKIIDSFYRPTPAGLDGNDDAGTLSAWYIFSTLGFYPIAGSDRYWLGSPAIDRATMQRPGFKPLRIVVRNQGTENVYVKSVKFDGEELCSLTFDHGKLMKTSMIEFEMSAVPTKSCRN